MSIAQTTRTEFGATVTLYRWECLVHPGKAGVWHRDRSRAVEGMRAHVAAHHAKRVFPPVPWPPVITEVVPEPPTYDSGPGRRQ